MYFLENKEGRRLGHGVLWAATWSKKGAVGRSWTRKSDVVGALERIGFTEQITVVELTKTGLVYTPAVKFLETA